MTYSDNNSKAQVSDYGIRRHCSAPRREHDRGRKDAQAGNLQADPRRSRYFCLIEEKKRKELKELKAQIDEQTKNPEEHIDNILQNFGKIHDGTASLK